MCTTVKGYLILTKLFTFLMSAIADTGNPPRMNAGVQLRLKGPSGAVETGVVATGKVSFLMKVENISYDQWIEPKVEDEEMTREEEHDSRNGSPAKVSGDPRRKNSPVVHPDDAIELNTLKRELELYKLNTQVLLQTKLLLEEKLSNVTNSFEDFKESLTQASSTDTPKNVDSGRTSRKSSATLFESPDDETKLSFSPAQTLMPSRNHSYKRSYSTVLPSSFSAGSKSAWRSAVDNITFGVTKEFKNPPPSSPIGQGYSNQRIQRKSFDSVTFSPPLPAGGTRLSHYQRPAAFDRVQSNESLYGTSELGDMSPVSEELCRHFLKGRCRYKRLCKFSHEVAVCPYCSIDLPQAKIAASTHLSRCFKVYRSLTSSTGSLDDDQEVQDPQDADDQGLFN
jgi:hypothetical protein